MASTAQTKSERSLVATLRRFLPRVTPEGWTPHARDICRLTGGGAAGAFARVYTGHCLRLFFVISVAGEITVSLSRLDGKLSQEDINRASWDFFPHSTVEAIPTDSNFCWLAIHDKGSEAKAQA